MTDTFECEHCGRTFLAKPGEPSMMPTAREKMPGMVTPPVPDDVTLCGTCFDVVTQFFVDNPELLKMVEAEQDEAK